MSKQTTVELDRTPYLWNGRSWSCLLDNTLPPLALTARLNSLLAHSQQTAEAAVFSERIDAARKNGNPIVALITGSRHWTNQEAIRRELLPLAPDTILIHGDANGADRLAAQVASELGIKKILAFPADWRRFGRAAGPIRNQKMLERQPDVVIAFHEALCQGCGTKNMVALARAAHVPVKVVTG
jgi:hypothetical protein